MTPVGARALVVLGVCMASVGGAGLAFDWGSDPEPAPAATQSVASPSSTAPANETPEAFIAAFSAALRNGDAAFLNDRYAPAVLRRYGSAECSKQTSLLFDRSYDLRLVSVSGPARWEYSTDGHTVEVDNVFEIDAEGTVAGQPATRQLHVELLEGRFRIFLDCGVALEGAEA